MTVYSTIADSEIDPESPGTTTLFTKLRNNPIAITEKAAGAPVLANGYVVTDMLDNAISPLILLSSQSISSPVGQVDFTGIDGTYDEYIFTIANLVPSVLNDTLWLRYSNDGGSTFNSGATDYRVTGAYDTKIIIASTVSNVDATGGAGGNVILQKPSSTTRYVKTISFVGVYNAGVLSVCGTSTALGAVDAVRFIFAGGNVSSGNIKMYGRLR